MADNRPKAILCRQGDCELGRESERADRQRPKEECVERNVGKGRKEWRHFAEVDEKRERSSNHTDNEVTMGNPDVGAGPLV
ncbi:hypothetical protein COCVIDRAFT_92943 [Bipolaris victoriae FI3]|uniref:Uncharacterized protein n=1 Tax=Bipolaris victoriae (strain FI3) TaxID=930091 RepID=W7ENA3_BIPV3|nr:hypothetical protein COCVIDRAFT_92943 [Bipolaris victoriae FI3]